MNNFIKIKQLDFTEEDVNNCESRQTLLRYEKDLLKLIVKAKTTVDRYKSLKDKGEYSPYEDYSKSKRFCSLLGVLHQIIKQRMHALPKDPEEKKERHINSYFVIASRQILTEKKFNKINDLAIKLKQAEDE